MSVIDPDLACARFLAGHWLGRGGDLEIEELWLAPRGGVAEGVVRVMKDGGVHALEYLLISAEADRVVLRFNHFNGDYTTWESKGPIELVLTQAADSEMIFESNCPPAYHAAAAGYRLTGPGVMTSWIDSVSEDGETTRFTFEYAKVM